MIKKFLLSLLALFLLIEEWLWDALTLLGRKCTVWFHLERLEEWLRRSPPYVALLSFMIPVIIVTPINLIAFWMIAEGIFIRGIMLELFAKLIGTVLIARVFALTRPQLMSFRWFSKLYLIISGWLLWAHACLSNTALYKAGKRMKAMLKSIQWPWNKS